MGCQSGAWVDRSRVQCEVHWLLGDKLLTTDLITIPFAICFLCVLHEQSYTASPLTFRSIAAAGTVYLFGKVATGRANEFVSCCAIVQNVHRKLFVVPRNDKGTFQDADGEIARLEAAAAIDPAQGRQLIAHLHVSLQALLSGSD